MCSYPEGLKNGQCLPTPVYMLLTKNFIKKPQLAVYMKEVIDQQFTVQQKSGPIRIP